MKRKTPIAATLAATTLAFVLSACGSGTSSTSTSASGGASPPCLPATLQHTAALPGTGVDVSPAPETDTANPHTQISFLGINVAAVRDVSVHGSASGAHTGSLHGYHQGDGASFVPNVPFAAGERVTVGAVIGLSGRERRVSFGFRVDTPYPTDSVSGFPNPKAAPADYESFYTLPGAQVPIMTVTVPDHDPTAGDILTTNGPGPGQYGPLIYTPQGRLVWFDRLSGGEAAENLNEQSYEGGRVLTWWKGKVLSLGFGQGEDLVMNSHYQTIARIPGANGLRADLHDFQIVPRDIGYITAFNPIRCDLAPIKGARNGAIVDTAVQEIDMKTGLVRWEWHSLDHVGASESEVVTPADSTPWDYFHLNSIDPEPDGDILISARSTWAGYLLEGGSGKVLWRLGGNRSSFKMGPGTSMAWQHDGRVLANGELTFFDDGSNPPIHHQSRGLRIRLDLASHQARLVSVYTHPDQPLLAASQGNMQTLPNGNAVVGFGAVPAISEFSAAGSLLFDAHQPLDMSFYRAFRFPWSARPLSTPVVLASLNNTGEETIVHASWNGATDVSFWRVLAGKQPGALAAQTTLAATAFESATTLPQRFAYVAVQALDATGRVIGASRPARVIAYAASLPGQGQAG
ncbi:MAG: arylsulfotransferase family protein [Solirubrobacteraceae bacterium]